MRGSGRSGRGARGGRCSVKSSQPSSVDKVRTPTFNTPRVRYHSQAEPSFWRFGMSNSALLKNSLSNKKKGDGFRDRIRDLCIAAGYDPITELKVNGKDVDLAFTINRAPHPVTVAIEAKHYNENLPKRVADEIVGSYKNAIERRDIDELWIVTSGDFSPDARDTLTRNSGFYAVPYKSFIKNLINFPRYIEFLNLQITEEGISDYYINQLLENGREALSFINEWHETPDSTPLAVLSTYGMGKSSLAKMIALELIRKWKSDPLSRIPIFVKLADLSAQQQIDGLLGSMFTNKVQVHGYSFPLFQKLNQLGHLTIILDGLDEMRHAMTWSDFEYNFKQISQLIHPRTKCIMLGRPNTFQDKREYQSIIEGATFVGEHSVKKAGSIEFTPLRLQPFDDRQTHRFFVTYMNWALRDTNSVTQEDIKLRSSEIEALELSELFSRPVHARMMADIASDMSIPLRKFNRHELYDSFITTILKRDYERHSGTGITPDQRRSFLRKLAWHTWLSGAIDSFRRNHVDPSWYRPLIDDADPEGILRELLSGSLIETKLGEVFYFSHRSFQEFLIAEHILEHPEIILDLVHQAISEETIEFLSETTDVPKLQRLLDVIASANKYSFTIFDVAAAIYTRLVTRGHLSVDKLDTEWNSALASMRKIKVDPPKSIDDCCKIFYSKKLNYHARADLGTLLASQVCFSNPCGPDENIDDVLSGAFVKYCLEQAPLSNYLRQLSGANSGVVNVKDTDGLAARVLAEALKIKRDASSELIIEVDWRAVFNVLIRSQRSVEVNSIYSIHEDIAKKTFRIDEMGAQSDPTLRTLRQMYASSAGRLRFVISSGFRQKAN